MDARGRPRPALTRRAAAAADLYAQGRVEALILTGGSPAGPAGTPSEAALMADHLRRAGVPEAVLILEPHARTTRQNARNSLTLLHRAGAAPAEVVVVTDALHLPRALMVFKVLRRRLGVEVVLRGHAIWPAERSWRWHLGWAREAVALVVDAVRVWRA